MDQCSRDVEQVPEPWGDPPDILFVPDRGDRSIPYLVRSAYECGQEDAYYRSLHAYAVALPHIADPLWRAGNGYGGYVMDVLYDACIQHGLPSEPVERQTPTGSTKRPLISRSLRKAVYERDAYRCVDCGDWHDLSCDHIVPIVKGGPTTLENLATRCMPCNLKKGSRS